MAQTPQNQPIYHVDGYHFYIKQYIEKNTTKIFEVIKFKGGWERWLQIELARTIKAEWHQPVLCEQDIWKTTARVDLWAKGAEAKFPYIGIELKCRTDLEQGIAFANRFHDDLKKIAKRPDNANTPCILYATGIGHREDVETPYTNVPDPNNKQPIPIYYEEVVQGAFLIYAWVEHHHA